MFLKLVCFVFKDLLTFVLVPEFFICESGVQNNQNKFSISRHKHTALVSVNCRYIAVMFYIRPVPKWCFVNRIYYSFIYSWLFSGPYENIATSGLLDLIFMLVFRQLFSWTRCLYRLFRFLHHSETLANITYRSPEAMQTNEAVVNAGCKFCYYRCKQHPNCQYL